MGLRRKFIDSPVDQVTSNKSAGWNLAERVGFEPTDRCIRPLSHLSVFLAVTLESDPARPLPCSPSRRPGRQHPHQISSEGGIRAALAGDLQQ